MREILFRGKRKRDGKWIEGARLHLNLGRDFICDGTVWIGTLNPAKEEVIPETVGQFTGLTDKNGKKIFEGDIVRHWNGSDDGYDTGRVFWDAEYCGWRRTTDGTFHNRIVDTYRMSSKCCYEVIGNIHDNPELLEATDDQ